MDFDHVVKIHADGTFSEPQELYSPMLSGVREDDFEDMALIREAREQGWKLLTGHTGQYGYNGPVMHPSETIGGGLARRILTSPGIYVTVVVTDGDDPDADPVGWAVARKIGG